MKICIISQCSSVGKECPCNNVLNLAHFYTHIHDCEYLPLPSACEGVFACLGFGTMVLHATDIPKARRELCGVNLSSHNLYV